MACAEILVFREISTPGKEKYPPLAKQLPLFRITLELDVKVSNIRRMERMQFPTRDEDFKRRLLKGFFLHKNLNVILYICARWSQIG